MQKKQVNIVHIITSLEVGGAQAVLYALVMGLPKAQFAHHVIYFHDGPYTQKLRDAGVSVYHIKGLCKTYDPVFCMRVLLLLKKLKPDVIHTILWSANLCGRGVGLLLRIPVILSMHNHASHNGRIRTMIDRISWFGFVHAIAVSEEVKNSYIKKNSSIFLKKMSVIVNGIDTQRAATIARTAKLGGKHVVSAYDHAQLFCFNVARTVTSLSGDAQIFGLPKAYRCQKYNRLSQSRDSVLDGVCRVKKQLGFMGGEFIFGTVGRLVPVKRHDFLIKSFAFIASRHAHARLVIVGDGPQELLLRALAQELNLHDKIYFVGLQDSYAYYPVFDCFVLSSASEGVSIALLEAMSCALPCVITNTSHDHPVITSGINGQVAVGDEYALANALQDIMASEVIQKKYAESAHDTVRDRFSHITMVQQYANLLRSYSA